MFFSMETFSESPRDSAIAVLFDLFCIIRTTGVRVAEYADTIQIQGMVQARAALVASEAKHSE